MHGINTIVGKIVAYPVMKTMITKNTCIVSFFRSSHYWGGQLDDVTKPKKITHALKTNMESCFYALILQAMSVHEHKAALMELCMCDDAQRSVHGLTPVAKDVVATVFDINCWCLTDQLIHICKPLIDVIGNVKAQDATLADCMLQLIWAHQELIHLKLVEGDDLDFLGHAHHVINTQFHAMNTDLHWLALFLHPLCQKLAISTAVRDLHRFEVPTWVAGTGTHRYRYRSHLGYLVIRPPRT
jgi:hypothetical protein